MTTSKTARPPASTSRLGEIRAQLAAVEAAADADPIGLADDLDSWAARDQRRRAQRLQLEHQLRDAEALGTLADDPELLKLVRSYDAEVGHARRELGKVRVPRQLEHVALPGQARADLETWARHLSRLARKLPADHRDARRFVDGEWARFFAARTVVLTIVSLRAGRDVPWPEDANGNLPGGGRYGYHRPGGAA